MDVGFMFEGFHVEPGGRQRPDGSWQPVAKVTSTATHEPLALEFEGSFATEAEAVEEATKQAEGKLRQSAPRSDQGN